MTRPGSEEVFRRALRVMPGGVSSPVRAFRAVGGTPVVFRDASGATFADEDGRRYVDYCMSWGPMILGHAHPEVLAAVGEAAREGLSFGAPSRREVALAERALGLLGREGWKIRFVSSGTEAVMTAVRLARGLTGRDRIVKFDGCYHGHSDSLLVKAGSGLATFGTASSAGVPEALASLTTVLPLDDEAAAEDLFQREGDAIAAVLIEPVPANSGLLLQRPEFLRRLRGLCARHGALLVFDEVISGFRVAPGGAAEAFGIVPDLATYGKILGGGMPVGALAGPAASLDALAPDGAIYQAGTLSGNPVGMAAGEATLRVLSSWPAPGAWASLEERGKSLEAGAREILRRRGLPASFVRMGSLFWLVFQEEPPRAWHRARREGAALYARLFHALLDRGIYWAPSAWEVGFLSLAHGPSEISRTLEALDSALGDALA